MGASLCSLLTAVRNMANNIAEAENIWYYFANKIIILFFGRMNKIFRCANQMLSFGGNTGTTLYSVSLTACLVIISRKKMFYRIYLLSDRRHMLIQCVTTSWRRNVTYVMTSTVHGIVGNTLFHHCVVIRIKFMPPSAPPAAEAQTIQPLPAAKLAILNFQWI